MNKTPPKIWKVTMLEHRYL